MLENRLRFSSRAIEHVEPIPTPFDGDTIADKLILSGEMTLSESFGEGAENFSGLPHDNLKN